MKIKTDFSFFYGLRQKASTDECPIRCTCILSSRMYCYWFSVKITNRAIPIHELIPNHERSSGYWSKLPQQLHNINWYKRPTDLYSHLGIEQPCDRSMEWHLQEIALCSLQCIFWCSCMDWNILMFCFQAHHQVKCCCMDYFYCNI